MLGQDVGAQTGQLELMTTEQLVAVLGAVTALVLAFAAVLRQVGELRREVDGRLTQLLELTRVSATAKGDLQGRAGAAADTAAASSPPGATGPDPAGVPSTPRRAI